MIKITVFKDSNGNYSRIELSGHAGAEEAGHDLVCAAVSVLSINTVNSIEQLTEDVFELDCDENGGYLSLSFPDGISEKAQLLMDALVLGLQGLEDDDKEEYIDLIFEEV